MKRFFTLTLTILIATLCLSIIGCDNSNSQQQSDYSQFSFTDTSWVRDSGHDIETIKFNSDGSFRYSCACGNPVNDADLCEGYTYDDKTKTITLDYIETTEETVTVITVVEYDDDSLVLDFDGEIRSFTKEI